MGNATFAAPSRLGRHEVILPLGDRARLAWTAELERWVVLRLLPAPDFEATLRAAKRAIGLAHPNVLEIVDVTSEGDHVVDVVEYAPGASLAELTVSPAIVIRIAHDLLVGLQRWHDHVGAHGDLSRATILVGTDGITRLGRTAVSLEENEPRGDVRRAGMILWETLANASLPPGDPPVIEGVPREVSDAVVRALATDPPSAARLAEELASAARSTMFFADVTDVAKVVNEAVRARLLERRDLVTRAARERHERPQSLPDVRTMIGLAGPPPRKRAPLPTLPDVPTPKDDGTSELRLAVAEPMVIGEHASLGLLGEARFAPLDDEPEPPVVVSPVFVPEEAAVAEEAPVVAPTPWTTKRLSIAVGAVGLAIGFVIVLSVVGRDQRPATAPSSAGLVALPVATTITAAAAIPPIPPPEPIASVTPEPAAPPSATTPQPPPPLNGTGKPKPGTHPAGTGTVKRPWSKHTTR